MIIEAYNVHIELDTNSKKSYDKRMSRKRRKWTPEEKATIVLEILRKDSTLAEISEKYEIAQPVLSRWKADFIANMSTVFDKKGEEIEKVEQEYEAEKEQLVKNIGELTLVIDFLKKAQTGFRDEEKKTLIEWEQSTLTVKRQCQLIGLPRSTAYYEPVEVKPSENEVDIKNAMDRIHFKEPSFGVRRIKNELHNLGFKTVGRCLESGICEKWTSTHLSRTKSQQACSRS